MMICLIAPAPLAQVIRNVSVSLIVTLLTSETLHSFLFARSSSFNLSISVIFSLGLLLNTELESLFHLFMLQVSVLKLPFQSTQCFDLT